MLSVRWLLCVTDNVRKMQGRQERTDGRTDLGMDRRIQFYNPRFLLGKPVGNTDKPIKLIAYGYALSKYCKQVHGYHQNSNIRRIQSQN